MNLGIGVERRTPDPGRRRRCRLGLSLVGPEEASQNSTCKSARKDDDRRSEPRGVTSACDSPRYCRESERYHGRYNEANDIDHATIVGVLREETLGKFDPLLGSQLIDRILRNGYPFGRRRLGDDLASQLLKSLDFL